MSWLSTMLAVGFPFYIWWAGWDARAWIGAYLGAIAITRLLAATSMRDAKNLAFAAISGVLAVFSLAGIGIAGLFYPAAINALLFVIFAGSVLFPPSVIERYALSKHGKVDDALGRYLRGVTIAWCGMFTLNGSVAAVLAVMHYKTAWFIYNCFVAYILILTLLVGEILFRPYGRNLFARGIA